jgi:hypothetical protein
MSASVASGVSDLTMDRGNVVFSETAINLCRDIVVVDYKKKDLSLKLKEELMRINVIRAEDTYESLVKDNAFMTPFRAYLSSFLSDDPKASLYGMGIVSDHDLFHNMSTDRDMKAFLKGRKLDKGNLEQLMLALGSKRKNLYEWFRRMAKSVVFCMQLPLTPDSPNQKKTDSVSKKRRITKEDVKNASGKQLEESKKRKIDDDDEADDEAEPEFVDKCTEKTKKKTTSSDKSVGSTSSKKTDSSGISIHQNDIVQLPIDKDIANSIVDIFKTSSSFDDAETKTYIIEVNNQHIRMVLTNNKLIVDKDIEIPTWLWYNEDDKKNEDEDEDDEEEEMDEDKE